MNALRGLVVFGVISSGCASAELEPGFRSFQLEMRGKPEYQAIAIAEGAIRVVWGGWSGAPSADIAQTMALERCNSAAAQHGMSARCRIYSVNGLLR